MQTKLNIPTHFWVFQCEFIKYINKLAVTFKLLKTSVKYSNFE